MSNGMKGYKAFDKDLKCRNMQYKIGEIYELEGEPIPCRQGFHFCKSIAECYDFYDTSENTRICKVTALGEIKTNDGIKYCTNKIKIDKEVKIDWERRGNTCASSAAGYCNTGYYNTGVRNTGCRNTGDCNTGNRNSGSRNTGDYNVGGCNTGDFNVGNCNTGNYNTGNYNTGYYNKGNGNTGSFNTGDRNSGDWNITSFSSGCFNTKEQKIIMFDKQSEWTFEDWYNSDAVKLLEDIPRKVVEWIAECDMSDEEKKKHPTYKTTGGYLKVLDRSEAIQIWWDSLTTDEKEIIYNIPNFDKEKFEKCVGIKI